MLPSHPELSFTHTSLSHKATLAGSGPKATHARDRLDLDFDSDSGENEETLS
jgi:hypothetical protein